IFEEKGVQHIASAKLVEALVGIEGHPWAEYRNGKELTANTLARLLAPFGISPGTIWLGDGQSAKGYTRSQFVDAFARYLPKPGTNHSKTTVRSSGTAENCEHLVPSETSGNFSPDGMGKLQSPNASAPPDALAPDFSRFQPGNEEIDIEETVDWRSEAS